MRRVAPYLIALLVVTNVLAVVAWQRTGSNLPQVSQSSTSQDKYPLLARRLFAESPSDVIINFSPLREALNTYFAKNVSAKYSFYFEYLPTGTSIRINSSEELVAASLLKLPVVMDLYKADEMARLKIDQEISLKKEWLDNEFGTLYTRGAGAKLTLREAAGYVLRESDNTALRAILASTNPVLGDKEHAVVELDVPYTIQSQTQVTVGAQAYTSMLKCLYFSCMLTNAHSQEILRLMDEAPDSGRIGAGLPTTLSFAHKIGTFEQKTQGDCGIVYLENRNYTVCMLADIPEEQAKTHMKAISSLIYQYLSSK